MPPNSELGQTIPPGDKHGVSVSLPTWEVTLGWAKRDPTVLNKMPSGYPRFFVHPMIVQLGEKFVSKFRQTSQQAMLFPTHEIATRCLAYLQENCPDDHSLGIICITLDSSSKPDELKLASWASLHGVLLDPASMPFAKQFWQHTGEGISSRLAEYILKHSELYRLNCDTKSRHDSEDDDSAKAKSNIRQRIAYHISSDLQTVQSDDVFLYPSGMNAITDLYRALLHTRDANISKVVAYGFLYVDTFKVLSKFGTKDAVLYGLGTSNELDELEGRLAAGERIMALFCELPGNPLLISPDLARIRKLADQYDFVVVCDDTVGTFINVNVLSIVDVVVTSLTKLFSGACNVMGGSVVVNPVSHYHDQLHSALTSLFVDTYFPLDALQMWQNSDDFDSRVKTVNDNAEMVAQMLQAHPRVETVYYPSLSPSKALYDQYKRPDGGYSYLVSVLFKTPSEATDFFDALDVAKGPSLGTNFTLACPYTLFGHYNELEWVAQFGILEHLVRISLGAEPKEEMARKVELALQAIQVPN